MKVVWRVPGGGTTYVGVYIQVWPRRPCFNIFFSLNDPQKISVLSLSMTPENAIARIARDIPHLGLPPNQAMGALRHPWLGLTEDSRTTDFQRGMSVLILISMVRSRQLWTYLKHWLNWAGKTAPRACRTPHISLVQSQWFLNLLSTLSLGIWVWAAN